MTDVWPMVHAERAALIDDLATLDEAQWHMPSLCGGWTVHDVVAHLRRPSRRRSASGSYLRGLRRREAHRRQVRLTASDADLTLGDGPEVVGPALSLLLAVARRGAALDDLDDLDGPGIATLAVML